MTLTVAVPTIPGRESLLSRCLFWLTSQAPGAAEIIVVEGEGQLGDKVNRAAQVATGSHFTVIDDDDWVTPDYMAHVLSELDDVDFVGFQVIELDGGEYRKTTALRGDLNRWGSSQRGPTPKGVTRTDIVRRVPLKNHYTADRDWLRQVAGLITSHAFIDRPLYVYDHYGRTFGFESGGRDVGVWPFDETLVTRI